MRRKFWPEPPEPSIPPEVSLSNISAHTPLTQDEGAPHRRLAAIRPTFRIINDNDYSVTDVTVGVRPSGVFQGGRQLPWHTASIRPRSEATVDGVEIPPDMFEGVHESTAQKAFVFVVHFKDHRGEVWERFRDAGTDQSDWLFHPPPLDASAE